MARFGLSLGMHARQELALLPRMLQAIEVLQLPATDLEGFLLQAVQENEVLRIDDARAVGAARADGAAGPPGRTRARQQAADDHAAWLESQASAEKGLREELLDELLVLDLPPQVDAWTRLLIECLDERGLLSLPDDALLGFAAERGLSADTALLGRAIAVLQGLEPRGVGGRDAVEALLLQLDPRDPDYALLCRLIEEFLEDIAKNKLPLVAKALGVEVARLQVLVARLRELDLAPGAALSAEAVRPIHCEVVVERRGDGFEVRVDQSGLPAVEIDPAVSGLARDSRQSPELRRYLRGRLDQARWLLEALEQRKRTLLGIASSAFERQRGFLASAQGQLVPLRMSEVADELGVHLSTVSRAVAGKYAMTPRGIVALRDLFVAPASGAGTRARTSVRDLVRTVVGEEDAAKPLSDDEIVAALARKGVEVARRTVAKYRSELGIPSSYRRRRHR